MSLENLKKSINKSVKGVNAEILSKSKIACYDEFIPTPIYNLNRIITGDLFKGFPSKTLVGIVGEEASFKSSLMCLCAANSQKQGFKPIYFDTEGAVSDEFCERWGLDSDNMLHIYTPFIEDLIDVLGKLMDSGEEKYFICIDSIGNLESKKLEEEAKEGNVKADQGLLAKKIKRMLKILLAIAKRQNSIAMFAGHLYANPSGYGGDQLNGGKHVRLAPHLLFKSKRTQLYDKEKNIIGNRIKLSSIKNRFFPPFQEIQIDINYREGVDKYSGLSDIAIKAGLIERSGAWYSRSDTGQKTQGASKIDELFDDQLLNKLNEYVQTTGYSVINKELEESLKEADDIIKGE